MPSMNRRIFGQTAAAAAGIALGPFVHTKRARAQDMVDVIIIGAGLSGLNAATILSESGLSVLVLEGSGRIGGRVWSAKESWETNAGEVPIELGASQVGPSYARVRDAILRYDLPMVNEDRSLLPFSFHIGGQHVKAADWPDAPVNKTVGEEREVPPMAFGSSYLSKFNPLVELDDWLSPKFSEYDVSISELFRRNGVSEAGIRLASTSTEMNAVSALRMLQEQTRGKLAAEFAGPLGDDGKPIEHWPKNFVGGTIALPLAMAGALPNDVRLNQQVVAIEMDNDGADVRTLDGSRYRSKFVISSLPFTVLRYVDIWPKPDVLHLDAIQNLDYFETTRAFCLIKEPFWQEDGFEPGLFTDGPLRMLWVIDNHKGEGTYRGMFVLTGITGNQVAAQSPEAAKAFLIKEMERLRPASKGQIEILRYHSWGNQPFQKGCSPMFAPGQVMGFANDMIIPQGRLHFCGEHTRRLDFGMEAAMESGERAAFEVLDRT